MKERTREIPVFPPARKELSDNPVKLCNEIAHIFRANMRKSCDLDGVMSQHGARLVLSVLVMGDGIKQRELVNETHLKPPTVSVIIKKMVEEGMVELRADEKDMRVTRVYLTEYGRKTDEQNIQRIRSVDAKGLRGLSEEEKDTLMSLLGRIRSNLLSDTEEEQ